MAAARTAKQKAALRKAQLASAKKRKRRALVRNAGRGVIGSKRGSRKKRYRAMRVAGGLVAAGAVAYGSHKAKQHLKTNDYSVHVDKYGSNMKRRVKYTSGTTKDGKSSAARVSVRGRGKTRYGVSVYRHRRR